MLLAVWSCSTSGVQKGHLSVACTAVVKEWLSPSMQPMEKVCSQYIQNGNRENLVLDCSSRLWIEKPERF